jgi:DNA-binding response OmpR family regulator
MSEIKMRILLIEDERRIADFIARGLEGSGYSVDIAENGQEGLIKASEAAYDLVILDLMLPDMDGLEVCTKIKDNPSNSTVRIIMLSQKKDEKDIIKGFECGADDYVTKPFSLGELEARVMRVLNR